ncbi:TniQ family protein [Azospirillum sp. 11R-A]|uniref:TniQ family protein n=1 Tax=Azospirillum sp. 11R-A TaxID=3111634 RepID=UPI003C24B058
MTVASVIVTTVLPLAPRPMEDELLSSWLSRVACRYDLDGGALRGILTTPGDDAEALPTMNGLDYRPAHEEIAALATAARLPVERLSILALKTANPTWPRHWYAWDWGVLDQTNGTERYADALAPGWCDLCLNEDHATGRHTYLRRHWAYAAVGFCHRHRLPLRHLCPFCQTASTLRFVPSDGGARLFCGDCGRPLDEYATAGPKDAAASSCADNSPIGRAWSAVMAFETDLCRALNRRTPAARWMGRTRPAAFIAATEDLIVALMAGQGAYPREHAINAFDSAAFPSPGKFRSRVDLQYWACCVPPARRRSLLAAVVSLLLDEEASALVSESWFGSYRWTASLDWLFRWLGESQRAWLVARSAEWPELLRQRLEKIAGETSVRRSAHHGRKASVQRKKAAGPVARKPFPGKTPDTPPSTSGALGLPDAAHYRRLAEAILSSPEWLAVRHAPPAVRKRTLHRLSEAALAASRTAHRHAGIL